MLAADHRLRDGSAFRRVVRSGRRAGSRALVAHVLTPGVDPGVDPGPARVGLVVSKAVGNAVTRNRVKRRLRHLAGAELAALPPGAEVVVRALPLSAELTGAELRDELHRCLERTLTRGARQ